jgi:hypothetical protein
MAKVEAVAEFLIYANKKELMRFFGMNGFYRKFGPNFSLTVSLLTNLFQRKQNMIILLQ